VIRSKVNLQDINYSFRRAKELMAIATVVNILQPVSRQDLASRLSKHIKMDSLDDVINTLIKGGIVRVLEDSRYMITAKGLRLISGSSLARRRDIQRMFHLSERQGG